MPKKLKLSILSIIVLLILIGCTIPGLRQGDPELTPKRQAVIWLNTYNATYDDVAATLTSAAATEAQKQIAREKKRLLQQIWPLLRIYAAAVDAGTDPPATNGQQLLELFNQLTAIAGGN